MPSGVSEGRISGNGSFDLLVANLVVDCFASRLAEADDEAERLLARVLGAPEGNLEVAVLTVACGK